MTLIQTLVTDNFIIQVADRRLTRLDGSLFDDHYTKLVYWNTSFTVGFSGLARIDGAQRKKTSEWIAETLCDYGSFERGIEAFAYWVSGKISRLPTKKGWEDKRLSVVIAGFDHRRVPLVAEITNFEPGGPLPVHPEQFSIKLMRRAPRQRSAFHTAGAKLTRDIHPPILGRFVPRIMQQPGGITRAVKIMVELQRRVSDDNPTVGRSALAVAIPRDRAVSALLTNIDPKDDSFDIENAGFRYFGAEGLSFTQVAPLFAAGGFVSEVVHETDPSNPDAFTTTLHFLKQPPVPPSQPQ